ncbi:MAG: serpin family protein [Deltaproteobacteria bacterium]|nr:serpin family protein [Deltaproteobacteria bacterium]
MTATSSARLLGGLLLATVGFGLHAAACKKTTDTPAAAADAPAPAAPAADDAAQAPATPDAAAAPTVDSVEESPPPAEAAPDSEAAPPTADAEPEPLDETPPPPPAEAAPLETAEAAAVRAAADPFAADLFARLAGTGTNVAFSPISVLIALGMTSAGARADTAVEMERVLHLGDDPDRTRELLGRVQRLLPRGGDGPVELAVANRLFAERSYDFKPEFFELLATQYAAPLERVDFIGRFEAVRGRINSWVAEQTRDRIPLILPDGSLDTLTRLVLVNAIYFKGKWALEFPKRATRPRPFTLPDGTEVEVPTMAVTGSFGLARRDGAQLLELPYRGDELSMVVVLPPEGTVPDAWLVADNLARIDRLPRTNVEVRLPSFTIDPPEPLNLTNDLKALGMPRAFDRVQAAFDGIADPPDPLDRLCIASVYHRTFVQVDEEGTEAAASTAVVMRSVRGAGPSRTPVFHADRPFLFFLRERRTGLILFAGRVNDPRARS